MSILRFSPARAGLLGACLVLGGCTSTPRFNDHFGDAVRANLSAQVFEPAGAANTNPTLGIDGTAARATQERYQRSFKELDGSGDQPMVGGRSQQ